MAQFQYLDEKIPTGSGRKYALDYNFLYIKSITGGDLLMSIGNNGSKQTVKAGLKFKVSQGDFVKFFNDEITDIQIVFLVSDEDVQDFSTIFEGEIATKNVADSLLTGSGDMFTAGDRKIDLNANQKSIGIHNTHLSNSLFIVDSATSGTSPAGWEIEAGEKQSFDISGEVHFYHDTSIAGLGEQTYSFIREVYS